MKTIYIDSDFICHVENNGTYRPVTTEIFDSLSVFDIEMRRFVPEGEQWIRDDGKVFTGQFVSLAYDPRQYAKTKERYEADRIKKYQELGIPYEKDEVASQNHLAGSFLGLYDDVYEVITTIPKNTSIVIGNNVFKTTVEHYLDTLKEEQ